MLTVAAAPVARLGATYSRWFKVECGTSKVGSISSYALTVDGTLITDLR